MNLWQHHCQTRWLAAVRPRIVAWPWENHGWERALCRAARERQVVTAGYQHTVVGPHQINYSPRSNSDGTASLPDHVICDGPAYRAELIGWDVPAERTVDGGALRFSRFEADLYDPDGPVFVPLSGTTEAAEAQLAAARLLSERGRHILVKSHPLYPKPVIENDRIRRTGKPLPEQGKLSAVLYSNGTSGLEGLLAGLPTFRLLLEDRIAVDVLPAFVKVTAVTLDTVVEAVERAERPARLDWRSVLSPPDRALWTRLLGADERLASCEALPYMAQDSIRE